MVSLSPRRCAPTAPCACDPLTPWPTPRPTLTAADATGTATVTDDTVTVTVTAATPTHLLGLVGIDALTVRTTASAQPHRAVTDVSRAFANSAGSTGGS